MMNTLEQKRINHDEAEYEADLMKEAIKSGKARDYKEAAVIADEKRKLDKLRNEAFLNTTVSVTQIIPEINIDGLSIKDNSYIKGKGYRVNDSVEDRDLKHMPSEFNTPFANRAYQNATNKEEQKFLDHMHEEIEKVFKGQIIVDLGAGELPFDYMIADRAQAKGYVAVEPCFGNDLLMEIIHLRHSELYKKKIFAVELEHNLNNIPVAVVEEDMLNFLKRLPDNSVSIWCSGIDYIVMSDQRYRNAVANEIMRVLSPDGGYIGQNTGGFDTMHIELPKSSDIEKKTIENKDVAYSKYSSISVYKRIKRDSSS